MCKRYTDCLSHTPMGDLDCNPGMCPDWELNMQSFDSQVSTQSTELHWPGQDFGFLRNYLALAGVAQWIERWPVKQRLLV